MNDDNDSVERRARLWLLMVRCGYMSDRSVLSDKGRGRLPQWVWVEYCRFRCNVDVSFRQRVIDILQEAADNTDEV